MSILVSRRIIRMKFDFLKPTSEKVVDIGNGNKTPELWKGNDVLFEIGIYKGTSIIDDVSNIASLTLVVRQGNAAGTKLIEKTITRFSNCADADWVAGSGKHAELTLSAVETNVAAGDHWLAVEITTTDNPGRTVTIGATAFKVADDGLDNEAAAQALDGLAYTKTQADGRYVQKHADQAWSRRYDDGTGERWWHYIPSTQLWYPEVAEIRDGVPVLTIGLEGKELP